MQQVITGRQEVLTKIGQYRDSLRLYLSDKNISKSERADLKTLQEALQLAPENVAEVEDKLRPFSEEGVTPAAAAASTPPPAVRPVRERRGGKEQRRECRSVAGLRHRPPGGADGLSRGECCSSGSADLGIPRRACGKVPSASQSLEEASNLCPTSCMVNSRIAAVYRIAGRANLAENYEMRRGTLCGNVAKVSSTRVPQPHQDPPKPQNLFFVRQKYALIVGIVDFRTAAFTR